MKMRAFQVVRSVAPVDHTKYCSFVILSYVCFVFLAHLCMYISTGLKNMVLFMLYSSGTGIFFFSIVQQQLRYLFKFLSSFFGSQIAEYKCEK